MRMARGVRVRVGAGVRAAAARKAGDGVDTGADAGVDAVAESDEGIALVDGGAIFGRCARCVVVGVGVGVVVARVAGDGVGDGVGAAVVAAVIRAHVFFLSLCPSPLRYVFQTQRESKAHSIQRNQTNANANVRLTSSTDLLTTRFLSCNAGPCRCSAQLRCSLVQFDAVAVLAPCFDVSRALSMCQQSRTRDAMWA